MTIEHLTKICPHCGSDDIGMEATVSWSIFSQAWETGTIYDGAAFCNTCERDEFEPLTCEEADKAHHFAAHKAGWRHGGDNGGFWYDGNQFDSWKAAVSAGEGETYGTAREVCEAHALLAEAEG